MHDISNLGVGTYVLIMRLRQAEALRIGKLGTFTLSAGYYAYVGSAMGSGGLRGRLGHHLKVSTHPHWHIDFLRAKAPIEQIWYLESPARREHDWADCLLHLPDACIAVPRFGASDCDCASHLFYFTQRPSLRDFQQENARRFPGDGHIQSLDYLD